MNLDGKNQIVNSIEMTDKIFILFLFKYMYFIKKKTDQLLLINRAHAFSEAMNIGGLLLIKY